MRPYGQHPLINSAAAGVIAAAAGAFTAATAVAEYTEQGKYDYPQRAVVIAAAAALKAVVVAAAAVVVCQKQKNYDPPPVVAEITITHSFIPP